MTPRPAIAADGLGKRYRIGLAAMRPTNLREAVKSLAFSPFRYLGTRLRPITEAETVWALKDVSFVAEPGEVIGIIGRNGAGKSTLLKILSRITDPTEGQAVIHGHVNSLLEVGTGFHRELTGRENIYLSAAMHGMKKREIDCNLDEIIEFSGIEKFINTPVKRYSSGMYTRLAFAVAAHLDPDILIVDEVLAVGDAAFQKRCLKKMSTVSGEGRTVLFVSHNMQAINTLCARCILLDKGRIVASGNTREVVEDYLESRVGHTPERSWGMRDAPGGEVARLRAVRILNSDGAVAYEQDMARPIDIQMDFWVFEPGARINVAFRVYNQQNMCLFAVGNHHDPEWGSRECEPGLYRCSCRIPGNYLNEGQHQVWAFVMKDKTNDAVRAEEVVSFHVQDFGMTRGGYTGDWIGLIRPLLPWKMARMAELP